MSYNYIVFYKDNKDFITIEHDFYNQMVDIFYNKTKIFSTKLKSPKTKETFTFKYQDKDYELYVNTKHFLFFKKDKFVLKENGVSFLKQKVKSKTWDVSTKKGNYHIHVMYNEFTSSMSVTINDQLLYDSLNKIKAFEPSIRKIDYDNQVFRFVKKKVENELFSLTLKMNNRDYMYCKEDLLFIAFCATLKRNSRNVSFLKFFKTKILECIIIPIFLQCLFCLHLYVFNTYNFATFSKELFTHLTFFGVSIVLVIIMYTISFIFYKRRFKN